MQLGPLRERINAPRSRSARDTPDLERLQPRRGDGALERRPSGRENLHRPRAISMPLARAALFRLPVSRWVTRRLQRGGDLLEFFNPPVELAHSAGANSFA